MKSGKTRFAGPPLLSRLRRRFAPLRGTQRRCAALFFAPPGRYAPCALRAQPFWKHEKNAPFLGKAPISYIYGRPKSAAMAALFGTAAVVPQSCI
jgi:hypothetical protein